MLWNDNDFGRAEKAEANKEGGWGSYSFCQRQHRCRHWSQLPKWGGDATALLKGGGGAQQAPPRGGEELSYRCVRERRYTSLNKGGDKALMTRRGRGRGKVLKGGVREGGRQVRRPREENKWEHGVKVDQGLFSRSTVYLTCCSACMTWQGHASHDSPSSREP